MDSSSAETAPTSESLMDTPIKEEIPSFVGILDLGWVKLKKGMYTRLTEAGQPLTEAEKPHSSSPHGLRFLKVISWIQLILGFICICLAVTAVAAAFQARESAAYDYAWDLSHKMSEFYQEYLKNVTNAEKKKLQMSFKERILSLVKNKCSDITYNEYNNHAFDNHYYEVPNYCYKYSCRGDNNDRVKSYHLIIDFLATPGWTGIMLIITSLVGFRLVSIWNRPGYIHVSQSHIVLNALSCIIFAPVMLATGILQIVFSDWRVPFRHGVGITIVVFASVAIILYILICVINCCCPLYASEENRYKRLTEDMTRKENDQEQEKDDADIIIA